MTAENRRLLAAFEVLREMKGLKALAKLHEVGLFRQTSSGTLSLMVASLIGRL
jgi:hypothetical protein